MKRRHLYLLVGTAAAVAVAVPLTVSSHDTGQSSIVMLQPAAQPVAASGPYANNRWINPGGARHSNPPRETAMARSQNPRLSSFAGTVRQHLPSSEHFITSSARFWRTDGLGESVALRARSDTLSLQLQRTQLSTPASAVDLSAFGSLVRWSDLPGGQRLFVYQEQGGHDYVLVLSPDGTLDFWNPMEGASAEASGARTFQAGKTSAELLSTVVAMAEGVAQ